MAFSKFVGSFLQATFFGGTYDDLSFELRVLKNELSALHDRLDKEFDALAERLDKLEGKKGKNQGRGRLNIVGGAELADMTPETPKLEAVSDASMEPITTVAVDTSSAGLATAAPTASTDGFMADMTIREAWGAHPDAPAVFKAHHLTGCPDCALSARESIADGAGDHGLDVQALLADLNQLASN
jgi:hybrid cluster-associated redox disulfide protein